MDVTRDSILPNPHITEQEKNEIRKSVIIYSPTLLRVITWIVIAQDIVLYADNHIFNQRMDDWLMAHSVLLVLAMGTNLLIATYAERYYVVGMYYVTLMALPGTLIMAPMLYGLDVSPWVVAAIIPIYVATFTLGWNGFVTTTSVAILLYGVSLLMNSAHMLPAQPALVATGFLQREDRGMLGMFVLVGGAAIAWMVLLLTARFGLKGGVLIKSHSLLRFMVAVFAVFSTGIYIDNQFIERHWLDLRWEQTVSLLITLVLCTIIYAAADRFFAICVIALVIVHIGPAVLGVPALYGLDVDPYPVGVIWTIIIASFSLGPIGLAISGSWTLLMYALSLLIYSGQSLPGTIPLSQVVHENLSNYVVQLLSMVIVFGFYVKAITKMIRKDEMQ